MSINHVILNPSTLLRINSVKNLLAIKGNRFFGRCTLRMTDHIFGITIDYYHYNYDSNLVLKMPCSKNKKLEYKNQECFCTTLLENYFSVSFFFNHLRTLNPSEVSKSRD